MGKLDRRSAIVTGAGRGFGRAIATALAREGASVTLVARTMDEIAGAAAEICAVGGAAQAVVADVADPGAIRTAYRQHVRAYGPTRIAVSCAGLSDPIGPVGAIDIDQWWTTMSVNLRAPLELMNLAVPDMIALGGGTIINLASIAALPVIPFNSAYAVSKAALYRVCEHVAAERKDAGIAVFAVHPGIAFTKLMQDSLNDDMRRWMPGMAEHFAAMRNDADTDASLQRCASHCVALATGRHDDLSGSLLDLSGRDVMRATMSGFAPPPPPA